MNDRDHQVFTVLFKDAYLKCFGRQLEKPITEAESKIFCNRVLEVTGLSIGWKSVKNYSFAVAGNKNTKDENPSTATLDTLARYVLGAPYTSEIQRKDNESHYPYWFLYREKFQNRFGRYLVKKRRSIILITLGIGVVLTMFIFWLNLPAEMGLEFTDKFDHISDTSLAKRGWFIENKDTTYWRQNASQKKSLTLYTLRGDNWPDPANKQQIKNLVLRAVPYDCFTAEVHLSDFVPQQEWQQAGILLMEDTTLTGRSVRLSIAYNDYFAGAHQPKEIYVQAISSTGNGFGKPEEFAHKPIAYPDSIKQIPEQGKMLQNSALRIEKRGKKFRFLYSAGANANGAFKEVVSQELDIRPKYIGIFAIKGFKDSTSVIPAHFTFFRIASNLCQ
ncbi:MAG TPA: hypothetical protein VG367_16780 [Mucilaginibacter sp.]|jgi:hypothetical protein|nr:hypothetical protein [Mucilaginibacter sp.]